MTGYIKSLPNFVKLLSVFVRPRRVFRVGDIDTKWIKF